jgi:hypothetical protein
MEELLKVEWDIDEQVLKDYEQKISTVSSEIFVFYESYDGTIKGISNQIEELDLPYISLSIDDVNKTIDGTRPIYEYKVVFSPDEKEFILIHIEEDVEFLSSVNEVIYQYPMIIDTSVPLDFDLTNDITVVQDFNDTCWKFYINGTLAYSLRNRNLHFEDIIEIYVTALNDPNILYKTLRIPLKTFVENYFYVLPFDHIDYSKDKISLYSRKVFSKYQFIRTKL